MKLFRLFILSFFFFASVSFQYKPIKIIFFGDSITQAGVREGGYINLMQEDLKTKNLSASYELIGAGIGGNKIYDLYLRIEEDVLAQNPDVVVIFVGVNDVWHKTGAGTGTDADKFEKFYQAVINKLHKQNIKVLLCTPGGIGERTDHTNQQDGDINLYSNIIRKLGAANDCEIIDLRQNFLDYNLENNPNNQDRGILTSDRVHLNPRGNRFVADKMWAALIK